MFTKILVCGLVIGCLAALAALLERSPARAVDPVAQIPGCDAGHHCQGPALVARISTERAVAMLAH